MAELLCNAKVGYSVSSPITWQSIPGLRFCALPAMEGEQVDTTVFGSSVRTARAGIPSLSPMRFRAKGDPNATWQDDLRDALEASTKLWWRVEVAANDARTQWEGLEFRGYVLSINYNELEPNKLLETEVTVAVSDWIGFTGVGNSQL